MRYRFFFHYRKSTGGMTVHFRGKCYSCKNVICEANCETKYNKEQPRLVLQGWADEITIKDDTIIIVYKDE